MSKELEALKQVKNFLGYNYCSVDLPNELKLIEQALQRLEAIDNSNLSEALESLKDLRDYLIRDRVNISSTKNYNTIKQALIKAQEQEKVLKVIFKKVFPLNNHTMIINHYKDYISYHSAFNQFYEDTYDAEKYLLSKEEFDLLKRYVDGL